MRGRGRRLTWRQRQWLRIGVGLLAGALGMLLILGQRVTADPAMTDLVVAAVNLPAGATLANDDLDVARVPRDAAPPGARTSPADVRGMTLLAPILAGEAVTDSRVLGPDDPRRTLDGLTAMPITLAQPGILPYLRPGQRVDVLWAPAAVGGAATAEVVASDVRVLVVPQPDEDTGPFSGGDSGDSTVVLEVDEATGLTLASATSSGQLSLLLRGG